MKTKILFSLIAISFSFVGCYTSFAAREYEEDTFGQTEENAQADSMIVFEDESGNLDTVYLYAGNYEEVTEEPVPSATVINNYYDYNECWFGGFYGYPRFYYPVSYYSCYDPYYYDPYCYDYYRPYYGGNIYVSTDLYVGHYSGGNYYIPSTVRYRTQQSHWTNLRNNDGGRKTSRKSRDSYRNLVASNNTRSAGVLSKGIDIDRDIRNSQKRTKLASLNDGGIRKADLGFKERIINTNNEIKRASVKSTKSNNPRRVVKREAVKQTRPKRTQNKSNYTRQNTSRKRTYTEIQKKSSYGKRKNSSVNNAQKNNSRKSSTKSNSGNKRSNKSYSSNRAKKQSNSRSSYNSNSSRRSNKPSSSYSSNSSSSKSSARSSYSGSSSRSSSRSSYSGSSSRSSSKSSGSSNSRSSSSRSSGRKR